MLTKAIFSILVLLVCEAFGNPTEDDCKLSRDIGKCDEGGLTKPEKRFYFNTVSRKCEQFEYSGCKGNKNNFKSEIECTNLCFKEKQAYDDKENI